jgi:lipoprotein-anchoring transpeptidase ErfK/SrfK
VIKDAHTQPRLRPDDKGAAVVRAQILLDRAHFSVGQIDGDMGSNMERALRGFEQARGLPASSTINAAVWEALNQDSAPVLIDYTISPEDLKGPFVQVPLDMMAQAKLDYLGYASPLDELAEKFHAAPDLLKRLNPGQPFDQAGENLVVPSVEPELAPQAISIVVSKAENTLKVLDQAGKVIAQYPCSSGSEHDPLPIGDWKVLGVARNPKFHYNPNLFWDAKPEDAKATIAAGPRGPVGLVWIDLSKPHYGIHGMPDPANVGHTQSHGCIRLTNWDALQLADLVKPGTPVKMVEKGS